MDTEVFIGGLRKQIVDAMGEYERVRKEKNPKWERASDEVVKACDAEVGSWPSHKEAVRAQREIVKNYPFSGFSKSPDASDGRSTPK